MKTVIIFLVIVIVSTLISTIDANDRQTFSAYLSEDRLLDSLIEMKWREYLLKKYKQLKDDSPKFKTNRFQQESNEENRGRTFVRRKLVGISDNPF
ncbi:unnamed protein product [Adineta ricciae]|uniref:Uncharacterized protein n=1 Tax=Adineta ricciae TaxID=249248 RepID=A0A816C2E1_ADIRI|nr:unnamed protein product [Adineta ricciae]CAF1617460.1 unnamed protein product [Adineta ricciae]